MMSEERLPEELKSYAEEAHSRLSELTERMDKIDWRPGNDHISPGWGYARVNGSKGLREQLRKNYQHLGRKYTILLRNIGDEDSGATSYVKKVVEYLVDNSRMQPQFVQDISQDKSWRTDPTETMLRHCIAFAYLDDPHDGTHYNEHYDKNADTAVAKAFHLFEACLAETEQKLEEQERLLRPRAQLINWMWIKCLNRYGGNSESLRKWLVNPTFASLRDTSSEKRPNGDYAGFGLKDSHLAGLLAELTQFNKAQQHLAANGGHQSAELKSQLTDGKNVSTLFNSDKINITKLPSFHIDEKDQRTFFRTPLLKLLELLYAGALPSVLRTEEAEDVETFQGPDTIDWFVQSCERVYILGKNHARLEDAAKLERQLLELIATSRPDRGTHQRLLEFTERGAARISDAADLLDNPASKGFDKLAKALKAISPDTEQALTEFEDRVKRRVGAASASIADCYSREPLDVPTNLDRK